MVVVRRVGADEWQALRDIRLRALEDSPELFLQVVEGNDDAASLHRSCGFEDAGPGEPHGGRSPRELRLTL